MRTKKALVNSVINVISYILILVPNFIVRKFFLTYLGERWLGVNSLFNNIIGFLSIMELGIGSAIIFSLYKPFAENDKERIKGYLDYYRKFYLIIGNIILIIGICLTPILNIFIKNEVNIKLAIIGYILFLLNTYITYLFSYKSCLLSVAQEEYKLSISSALSKVIICTIQIVLLRLIPSFIIYLLIQLLINLFYYILLNRYIDSRYEWIKDTKGLITYTEKRKLTKNIRALFLHKIGMFVVNSTDNLLISYFIDLATVSKFNSFNMVIGACKTIIGKGISGVTASIGNLLVSEDTDNAYNVHKRIFFISFWIVSFICILLYNVLNQLIVLWLGESQLIDKFTFSILIFNLYFSAMRSSVEKFQEGSGNFVQDRYAPICESIINLISSIILVKCIGLPGIFLGTLISNISVVFWTKPLVVYKYVFNKKLREYYKMYFKYLVCGIIPLGVTILLSNKINNISFTSLIVNCLLNTVVINSLYLIIFCRNKELIYYKKLIITIIKKCKEK